MQKLFFDSKLDKNVDKWENGAIKRGQHLGRRICVVNLTRDCHMLSRHSASAPKSAWRGWCEICGSAKVRGCL